MLVIAITISAIAAWYSVAGLTAIFSAAVIPVIIMGGALEAGKIVATVWLHNNWARASWAYKTYLVPAIVALMLLTSMGIFGFLSKGHADQSIVSGDAMSKVAIFDEKIATERENIAQAKRTLEQMNAQVDQMLSRTDTERGTDKAVVIRKQQSRERAALQAEITKSQKTIQQLQAERAPLAAEFRKVEAEVGPIKYIAALIYGDNPDQNLLEAAVRWVIILIVVVFDPLALCLILAANKQLEWARQGRGGWVHDEEETTAPKGNATDEGPPAASQPQYPYDPDDGPLTLGQLTQIKQSVEQQVCPKCQTALLDATGIGPFCPNKECDVVDGINLHKNTADSPEEFFDQVKEIAQRLDAEPKQELVEPEDELSQEEIEQIRIDEINRELAAIEPTEEPVVEVVDESELNVISAEERALALLDSAEEIIQELSNEVTTKNAHIANIEADYVQLQNNSIHWIQEQQDLYRQLEEVEATRNVEQQRANNLQAQLDELLAEKNLKEATLTQNIAADNSYQLKKSPSSSFGIEFPANPGKGDLFLRTDFLPTKLFKFNGLIWIETDKNKTDTYTYNDQYVEFLIEKLRTGEYSAEDINDAEHEQIAQYLQDKNGKSS